MDIDNLSDLIDQAEEGFQIQCRDKTGKVNLFAKSSCGDTFLHVAVGRGNESEISFLVKKGLDIDAQGDYLETPLFSAAAQGQVEMVRVLLKLGANPKICDNRGDLPQDVFYRATGVSKLPTEGK